METTMTKTQTIPILLGREAVHIGLSFKWIEPIGSLLFCGCCGRSPICRGRFCCLLFRFLLSKKLSLDELEALDALFLALAGDRGGDGGPPLVLIHAHWEAGQRGLELLLLSLAPHVLLFRRVI